MVVRHFIMILYLIANDVFALAQNLVVERPPGLVVAFASNTLVLTQQVGPSIKPGSVSDQITFTQTVQLSHPLHASNYIEFHQQVSQRTYELFVNDLLAMTHLARTVTPRDLSQYIGFMQSVNATRGIGNTIVFTDSVIVELIHVESVIDTLTLTQGVTVYKYNDPTFIQIPLPPPPPYTPVVLSLGTNSVTLDIPDFGNSDEIELARINRTTRAGTLIIFRDPVWPSTEILKMTFSKLTEAKAKRYLQFIEQTLGKEISMVDHEGQTWSGIIINPEAEIECNDRSCEPYQADLEFQGVKI